MRYRRRTTACFGLVVLFLFATLSPLLSTSPEAQLDEVSNSAFTPVGQSIQVSIPVYPNGTSSDLKIEVPAGEALQELDLELQPRGLPIVEEFTWDRSAHFNTTAAVFDNIDYNKTGMTILPRGVEWDFEGSAQGWTLSTSGGWAHGYDTTLGQTNGVHSGNSAIYTYNGNYPNYMGSTYYATSPTFDCTSCSGQWTLQYWKRLGVESSSWDHAYVQVKNAQGSWSNLWSNSGTINDGSFTQVSHSIGSYISNNPSAQIRFGLGRTDGSVTYTGWNVDDISILPTGGVSGGYANWTSPDFGHQAVTGMSSVPGPYGVMSLDAIIPQGADLRWTIFDATTLSPIPGFIDRNEHVADLGIIDWETHPSLRLKLSFVAGSGGSPHVYSINFQGRIVDDFFSNPVDDGWTLGGASWSSTDNRLHGSANEIVLSPIYEVTRPISRIRSDMIMSGSVTMDISVDGGNWTSMQQSTTETLNDTAHNVRFRFNGGGSYWQVDRFESDLQSSGIPINPRIDVGLDNRYEWEIPGDSHGQWGLQNRLGNGQLSHKLSIAGSTQQVSLLLPTDGLNSFAFDLTPLGFNTTDVEVEVIVGGIAILNSTLGTITKSTPVIFGSDELTQLNAALFSAPPASSGEGYSMAMVDLEFVASSGSDLLMRGLRAPYSPTAVISADGDHPLVRSINEVIASKTLSSGTNYIPLTLQSSGPAGFVARLARTTSATAPTIVDMSMTNVSQTEPLTPSWQWIEVNVLFDTMEDPQRVELELAAIKKYAGFQCSADAVLPANSQGEMPGNCQGQGDTSNVEWHPLNPMSIVKNGTLLRVEWSFRFAANWDDEELLDVRTSMVTVAGTHSLPEVINFGSGSIKGLENDITLDDWWVINQNGDTVTNSALYLSPGATVTVVADLGFEGVGYSWAPRSGDVQVSLWQGGTQLNSTTEIDQGLAMMTESVPSSGAFVTWEIRISGLNGQGVQYSMKSYTFQTDSLNPKVTAMSIDRHDHLAPNTNQRVEFTIYDQPVLPTKISLYLWKQWVDDHDNDSYPDAGEYSLTTLESPSNLSASSAQYFFEHDDTMATDGDLVAGYLDGSDPAGNSLIGGGNSGSDQHLFMYQVRRDIAPNILSNQVYYVDGEHQWLHPETNYELIIPFEESNGMSDVASTRIEMSSNSQSDVLAVEWNGSNQICTSISNDLLINSCSVGASFGNSTPYSSHLEMRLSFQLQWSLLPNSYLSREPSFEVVDRAGQSSFTLLPEMRWRYSPDMMIARNSMNVSIDESVPNSEGAWVRPGASATIHGEVMWSSDGTLVLPMVDVSILLDGERNTVVSNGGGFNADISMPLASGDHPLSVELANIHTNAEDLTDRSTPVMWIVVDGEPPVANGVASPRTDAILNLADLEELELELRVTEFEQLNLESLRIHWRFQPLDSEPGAFPVAEGEISPSILDNRLSGQSIPIHAVVNLAAELEEGADLEALELIVWISGSDMAGNPIDDLLNSEVVPIGKWPIEQRAPVFEFERADIEYSKLGDLSQDDSVTVSVTIHNVGKLGGQVELLLEEVRPGGERLKLDQTHLYISANSHNTSDTVWDLEGLGAAWVEVTIISTGEVENGPTIRVVEEGDDGFLSTNIAGVDSLYIWLAIGLSILLMVVVVALLRQEGSGGHTWVDEEEWEDEISNQTALVNHEQAVKDYAEIPATAQPQQATQSPAEQYSGHQDPYANTQYLPPQQ